MCFLFVSDRCILSKTLIARNVHLANFELDYLKLLLRTLFFPQKKVINYIAQIIYDFPQFSFYWVKVKKVSFPDYSLIQPF